MIYVCDDYVALGMLEISVDVGTEFKMFKKKKNWIDRESMRQK